MRSPSLASELSRNPPTDDVRWQESMLLTWFDEAQRVGGIHRIGHAPNAGTSNLWCGIIAPDGRHYRRNLNDLPLTPADREHPHYRSDVQSFVYDDRFRVSVQDEDVAVELEVEDFYPLDAVWDHTERTEVEQDTVANHLESSGRVRGVARLGGREWRIDGLAHRDHSWGNRVWSQAKSHRWVAGSCGPDLSYSLVLMTGASAQHMAAATVIDHGVIRRSRDLEIVTLLDFDGLSCRGGWATVRFDDATEFHLDCEPVGGWTFAMDEFIESDVLCTVRTADGRSGFCDLEYSNGRTDTAVGMATGVVFEDGVRP